MQAAARKVDAGTPFVIRPARTSDVESLLRLENESWWPESRASRDSIISSIGSLDARAGRDAQAVDSPGYNVFVLEGVGHSLSEHNTAAGKEMLRLPLLGSLFTQFIETEGAISSATNVHSCSSIRSPWHGRTLQLIRVNTARESRNHLFKYRLISAGSLLRDFSLVYAAELQDVDEVIAVTRCSDFEPGGISDTNNQQVLGRHVREYVERQRESNKSEVLWMVLISQLQF